MPHRSVLYLVVLLTAAACQSGGPDEAGPGAEASTPDRKITPASELVFGSVGASPDVSLGGADATGPTQFTNVRSVFVDSSERIWVADGGSAEIRVFDRDGAHLFTTGGRGQGPGEFGRPRILGELAGDSLAVWDDVNPRLTVFDGTGAFTRTAGLASGEGLPPQALGLLPDGRVLGQVPSIFDVGELVPNALLTGELALAVFDDGGGQRRIATVSTARWIWTGEDQVPLPFSVAPSFAVVGNEVHLVHGPALLIRVYEDDVLTLEYGVDEPARPVTGADRSRYAEYFGTVLTDAEGRQAYVDALEHPELPDELPGYDRALADDACRVWAQRYSIDPGIARTWDVYSPDHVWVGSLTVPRGFDLRAVRGGRLVGVWRDDLLVEHVRAYTFTLGERRTSN